MSFLGSLLGGHKKETSSVDPDLKPLLDFARETLGQEVFAGRDSVTKVASAFTSAAQYFDRQIQEIPGPVGMSGLAHAHDAFLCAVFPEMMDIQAALGRSIAVKDQLPRFAEQGQQRVFGLIGMRFRDRDPEAKQPGLLADHTLTCLSTSVEETRRALREAACRRVVLNFHAHLDKLRQKGKLFSDEWNIEHFQTVRDSHADSRRMIFEDYRYAETELTPDNILRGLVAWLAGAAEHFHVEVSDLAIPCNRGAQSVTYTIPLIAAADRRRWHVALVEFSTQEGLRALTQEARVHRYILI